MFKICSALDHNKWPLNLLVSIAAQCLCDAQWMRKHPLCTIQTITLIFKKPKCDWFVLKEGVHVMVQVLRLCQAAMMFTVLEKYCWSLFLENKGSVEEQIQQLKLGWSGHCLWSVVTTKTSYPSWWTLLWLSMRTCWMRFGQWQSLQELVFTPKHQSVQPSDMCWRHLKTRGK